MSQFEVTKFNNFFILNPCTIIKANIILESTYNDFRKSKAKVCFGNKRFLLNELIKENQRIMYSVYLFEEAVEIRNDLKFSFYDLSDDETLTITFDLRGTTFEYLSVFLLECFHGRRQSFR